MAKEIKNVEVFSVGTWNGDTYTREDLDEMVKAFEETKSSLRPSIKLGHPDKQVLLAQEGMPAAGWIGNLYRNGIKLIADFVDLPDKIYKVIKEKGFRRVSSEICWDIDIGNGKVYKRMLSAVALLGNELPAVSNLKEILALYNKFDQGFNNIKCYTDKTATKKYYEFNDEMGEKMPIEELKKENDKLKKDYSTLVSKVENLEKSNTKITELEESNKTYKVQLEEQAKRNTEIEREKFIVELSAKNLCSPSMKPYVVALLDEKTKKYTINEKEISRNEVVTNLLTLAKEVYSVNFDESSEKGKFGDEKTDTAINEKIEKYSLDNKCSYREAYNAITSS